MPPSLVERIQAHGATVSIGYGQSECPLVTQSGPAGDAVHVSTTVGVAVPHTELRILAEDGRDEGLDTEGFLHTGDLGTIDAHGVVRIHGRVREVIIRGGKNIYPTEVEDVLLRHPAVDAAAVIAAPSRRWGEEVAAVVRLTEPNAATSAELTEHAAGNLAHFKVPRHWRFVDTFPITASGKIRKIELLPLFPPHD